MVTFSSGEKHREGRCRACRKVESMTLQLIGLILSSLSAIVLAYWGFPQKNFFLPPAPLLIAETADAEHEAYLEETRADLRRHNRIARWALVGFILGSLLQVVGYAYSGIGICFYG